MMQVHCPAFLIVLEIKILKTNKYNVIINKNGY